MGVACSTESKSEKYAHSFGWKALIEEDKQKTKV